MTKAELWSMLKMIVSGISLVFTIIEVLIIWGLIYVLLNYQVTIILK